MRCKLPGTFPLEAPEEHPAALLSVYKRKMKEKDIDPEIFVDFLILNGKEKGKK